MNVRSITAEWLKINGFDGLYADGDCACSIDDLMPCDECSINCAPGYKTPCDCGEHDYHISAEKETP